MRMNDYQTVALKTAASNLKPEKIDLQKLYSGMVLSASVAAGLDRVKKGLVYGKDMSTDEVSNTALAVFDRYPEPHTPAAAIDLDAVPADVTHAILGIVTEAGELAEAWLEAVLGRKPLDLVNLKEEFGDLLWYEALGCHGASGTLEEAATTNVAKLAKRYGDQFSELRALVRDTAAERVILESTGAA